MVGAVSSGLVLALALGSLDFAFNAAVRSEDIETAVTLEPLYLRDPVVMNIVAQGLSFEVDDDASRDRMLAAFERTIEIEPTRSHWWIELARRQGLYGDPESALASAQEALKLEPFDQTAWRIVRVAAEETGDVELEREASDMLCKLGVDSGCDESR